MARRLNVIHRTPEDPGCPGRYHNTMNAAKQGGCICPRAVMIYRDYVEHQSNIRAILLGKPRSFEIDPKVVERAVRHGGVAFRTLSRAEKKIVVRRLVVERRMSDIQIAEHLLWSPDRPTPTRRNNVAHFRRSAGIPAALPQPAGLAAATAQRRELVNTA